VPRALRPTVRGIGCGSDDFDSRQRWLRDDLRPPFAYNGMVNASVSFIFGEDVICRL
jgi:hypothetical protein